MIQTISKTNFKFPNQTGRYHGKVRDVYTVGNELWMIATDRISAFDHILPEAIPYKGQVLNQLAQYFLKATEDIVPNWLTASPDPNVSVGYKCEPIKIEMVVRGYLAGHAARTYKKGIRMLCGVELPEGLKENEAFAQPIITPSTKADEEHDEDIAKEEIIAQKIVAKDIYEQLEKIALALFKRGSEMATERNLILVDTKYEFGLHKGEITLIDEIHTPDSSRYYYADDYSERMDKNEQPRHLSKEFVRQWLIENGFQGKEGQKMPQMNQDIINRISQRYIELFEKLTHQTFVPANPNEDALLRIEQNLLNYQK